MPNISILQQSLSSQFLQAVVDSNERKKEQLERV